MGKLKTFISPVSNQADNKHEHKSVHPFVMMVCLLLICFVISYIVPAGNYERITTADGTELIDPDSFIFVERTPVTPWQLLLSVTQGMQRGASIIFFLLIIGGMFSILNATSAINVGIANMLKKLSGKEFLIVPILMIFFGCGSAFCGNFEEFLVFVPLILAICITIGYDSLTAVGMIFLAAAAGYGGSITNSFTVGTAQEIAGLERFSGMDLRIILFIILESASIIYVLWYSRIIKKTPKLSGAYEYDSKYNKEKKLNLEKVSPLTSRQTLVLTMFGVGIAISIWGIITQGYYVDELAAIFLLTGVLGGFLGGLKPGEICRAFEKGCHDMLLPSLMIGLANSIVVLLSDANILDIFLHYLAEGMDRIPTGLLACVMFLIHSIFNVVVPSGSAQAITTMPLMIPLADAAGITRQTAVLAYQLGDAFTNVLAPTGGEILAALAICRVPYSKWLKFLLPIFVIWCLIALVFLVYATQTGYGPM